MAAYRFRGTWSIALAVCWSASALAPPATGQGSTQSAFRARIQQMVLENMEQSAKPAPQQARPVPKTRLRYWKPKIELDMAAGVLWYDFGEAKLDGEYYDLSLPGYSEYESNQDDLRPDLAPVDEPPPAPVPAPAAPSEEPKELEPNIAEPTPFYYPIKAQLLVEILRKHRAESRASWEPVLQEIEKTIARELKAIESADAADSSELEEQLLDCDLHIYRLAVGHLDRVAREKNLFVRRAKKLAEGEAILGFSVTLLPDPGRAQIYVISDFKYWCLQRKKNEGDFSFWDRIDSSTVKLAGDCHVVAVWKEGERTITSDYRTAKTIASPQRLRLIPNEAPMAVR